MVQTSDGGYAIAGYSTSYGAGEQDVYLVKIDSNGFEQWRRTYSGANGSVGYSMVQTSDGGYAIAGFTWSSDGSKYVYLVKTDIEFGIAQTDSSPNTITLYRGATDLYWNYVRVRIWTKDG